MLAERGDELLEIPMMYVLSLLFSAFAVWRTRSERELAESEAQNRAILDSALDCVITIDQNGQIREFNPAAELAFGCRREEILGREIGDTIIPPSLREAHRNVEVVLDGEERETLER